MREGYRTKKISGGDENIINSSEDAEAKRALMERMSGLKEKLGPEKYNNYIFKFTNKIPLTQEEEDDLMYFGNSLDGKDEYKTD